MAVYRVNKNRGYTVMANFHLRDKNLSLKAVGLLSKMLSFNDGWKFSTRGLSAICKEGPDAILSALRELERHGYLVRHRHPQPASGRGHRRRPLPRRPPRHPRTRLCGRECLDQGGENHPELRGDSEQDGVEEMILPFFRQDIFHRRSKYIL